MTEVSQNNYHSMSALATALDKLKRLRGGTDTSGSADALTPADMDALIEHCDSTIGNVRLSDVPM